MLAVAQAILYVRDKEGAEAVAEAAVTRSEALSLARRVAAEQASRIGQPPCSATDIDSLKEIAFRSSYMNDIGRIRDGRLVCSALWGARAPTPSRPTLLQRRCPALARIGSRWLPYTGSNLIAQGDTFTVSSPSAFESLDPARSSSISIETKDRSFTFRTLSPTSRVGTPSLVQAQHCSRVADVCAFVTSPRHVVSELPSALLTTILSAGASVGLLLAFLLIKHQITARQTIQQRLVLALKRSEIELAYQPLRRIGTRELVGFEALSRWRPPGDDEIPPAIFVPIAHRFGLSPDLFDTCWPVP